jgi:hypothetical protein
MRTGNSKRGDEHVAVGGTGGDSEEEPGVLGDGAGAGVDDRLAVTIRDPKQSGACVRRAGGFLMRDDSEEEFSRWCTMMATARAAKRRRVRQRLAQLLGQILAADIREYPALPSDAIGVTIPAENDHVPRATVQ